MLEVGRVRGFPNRGYANEEFWKIGSRVGQGVTCFPRLAQKGGFGLWIAASLCEKRGFLRVWQGVQTALEFTIGRIGGLVSGSR